MAASCFFVDILDKQPLIDRIIQIGFVKKDPGQNLYSHDNGGFSRSVFPVNGLYAVVFGMEIILDCFLVKRDFNRFFNVFDPGDFQPQEVYISHISHPFRYDARDKNNIKYTKCQYYIN